MANRYIRNIDEKTLAKSIDEVRKTFCEERCESCPWKLENDKCLLITAENHASERYHERFNNLKKHYGRVCSFIMGLNWMELEWIQAGKLSEGRYLIQNAWAADEDPDGVSSFEYKPDSVLDLIETMEDLVKAVKGEWNE